MQALRIFISSPGDVAEERQISGKVIERLQGKYWSFVRLDDVFWEKKVIRATAHYQDELVQPSECEIVFGILWSRLGSPLPGKFQDGGGDTTTGTEWELENAFDAYEKNKAELLLLGKTEKETHHLVKPHIVVYRRKTLRTPFSDSEQEAKAATQEKMLAEYLNHHFHNADEHHTIKRPITQYASLEEFETKLSANLEELILRMIPALKPGFEPPPISGSPFKGLRAFEFADSDRYFGRNREIREIQQRLIASANKGMPFLLIYGGSGYGKSSLMRAGLAPVLTRSGGSLNEIAGWRRVALQPAKGDGSLIERLSRAILLPPTPEESAHARLHPHYPLTGLAELSTYTNEDTTLWDSAALVRHFADADQRVFAIAAIVETLRSLNRHLLLEIDQLEEIFTTPSFDDVQRSAFIETIGELCATDRVWTVGTMRSEFFPRVAEQPELFQLVGKDRGYILSPPDRQSLREIIRYPALAARLDFERRVDEIEIAGEKAKHDYLHDQILADSEGSPDALPLLEFTLQQLYDERDQNENLLTWTSYAAAGGLKGAIAKRATGVFKTLDPVAQETRHQIFAALVQVDAARGTQTRKRAPLATLGKHPGSATFIQEFLAAHLLITDEDTQTKEPVITLAHEALITHWDELSTWIKDHRGDLLARQRLAEQVKLWNENGKKKSYLLSEARLAEAERVKRSQLFILTDLDRQYLESSQRRANRKQRLLWGAVGIFAAVAAIAIGAGGMARANLKKSVISENATKRQLASNDFKLANQARNSGEYRVAFSHTARALRNDPANQNAAHLAWALLTSERLNFPTGEIRLPADCVSSTLSADHSAVIHVSRMGEFWRSSISNGKLEAATMVYTIRPFDERSKISYKRNPNGTEVRITSENSEDRVLLLNSDGTGIAMLAEDPDPEKTASMEGKYGLQIENDSDRQRIDGNIRLIQNLPSINKSKLINIYAKAANSIELVARRIGTAWKEDIYFICRNGNLLQLTTQPVTEIERIPGTDFILLQSSGYLGAVSLKILNLSGKQDESDPLIRTLYHGRPGTKLAFHIVPSRQQLLICVNGRNLLFSLHPENLVELFNDSFMDESALKRLKEHADQELIATNAIDGIVADDDGGFAALCDNRLIHYKIRGNFNERTWPFGEYHHPGETEAEDGGNGEEIHSMVRTNATCTMFAQVSNSPKTGLRGSFSATLEGLVSAPPVELAPAAESPEVTDAPIDRLRQIHLAEGGQWAAIQYQAGPYGNGVAVVARDGAIQRVTRLSQLEGSGRSAVILWASTAYHWLAYITWMPRDPNSKIEESDWKLAVFDTLEGKSYSVPMAAGNIREMTVHESTNSVKIGKGKEWFEFPKADGKNFKLISAPVAEEQEYNSGTPGNTFKKLTHLLGESGILDGFQSPYFIDHKCGLFGLGAPQIYEVADEWAARGPATRLVKLSHEGDEILVTGPYGLSMILSNDGAAALAMGERTAIQFSMGSQDPAPLWLPSLLEHHARVRLSPDDKLQDFTSVERIVPSSLPVDGVSYHWRGMAGILGYSDDDVRSLQER